MDKVALTRNCRQANNKKFVKGKVPTDHVKTANCGW